MKILFLIALTLLLAAQQRMPFLPSNYYIWRTNLTYPYDALILYGGFPSVRIVQDGKRQVEVAYQFPEDFGEIVEVSQLKDVLKLENLRQMVFFRFFKTLVHNDQSLKCLFLYNFQVVESPNLKFKPDSYIFVSNNGSLTIDKIAADNLTLILERTATVNIRSGAIKNLTVLRNSTGQALSFGLTKVGNRHQGKTPSSYRQGKFVCSCMPEVEDF